MAADPALDPRTVARALEDAVGSVLRAPSVPDAPPWRLALRAGVLEVCADHSRRPATPDRHGRGLAQSAGSALLGVRVSLAATGLAVEVHRLPRPGDPDLLATVTPVRGLPDAELAALAPAVTAGQPARGHLSAERAPEDLVRALVRAAAAEGATLLPVLREDHLRLLVHLVREADRAQHADPAARAGQVLWTTRQPESGVARPTGDGSGTGRTLALLVTDRDDELAWLRSGEALRRVLLVAATHGWAGDPLPQVVEVPVVRLQVRSALTWDAHPQHLLHLGRVVPPLAAR
ncbi:hypothetical protein [Blastococcus sp. VKM Ac-2987]|uniref:hypothetical protein n=1 Tax=Blastococcus sp. VKM Ac-2987 TaxID=3004141 RepID=UPI0022AB983C|nr:hypothetical protein [Blastococcus sp. VKM Ac-2987]MCZ2860603.1 hypothetical protein [Blastococcus sp. VKM Ac-2987]